MERRQLPSSLTGLLSLIRLSVLGGQPAATDTYTVTKACRSTSAGSNESRERRTAAGLLLIGLTSEVDTPGWADKGVRSMPRRLGHGRAGRCSSLR